MLNDIQECDGVYHLVMQAKLPCCQCCADAKVLSVYPVPRTAEDGSALWAYTMECPNCGIREDIYSIAPPNAGKANVRYWRFSRQ